MHINKLMAVFIAASFLILSSCTSIPKLAQFPAQKDSSKLSHIMLVTANKDEGWAEQFGGLNMERHCMMFPTWKQGGGVAFGDNYIVYAEDDWETENNSIYRKRYRFNYRARFDIPAGDYTVCAYKLTPNKKLLKAPFGNKKFHFEAGANYEIRIFYAVWAEIDKKKRTVKRKLEIKDIRKVDKFTDPFSYEIPQG